MFGARRYLLTLPTLNHKDNQIIFSTTSSRAGLKVIHSTSRQHPLVASEFIFAWTQTAVVFACHHAPSTLV
jgi:hypothetical protein